MTRVTATRRPPRTRPDLRTFDRILAAILMPLGPAAAAVTRYVIPPEPVGAAVTADPGSQRLVLAMGVVITFTIVPGALAALRLLRRRAPRLTLWTGAFLVPVLPRHDGGQRNGPRHDGRVRRGLLA